MRLKTSFEMKIEIEITDDDVREVLAAVGPDGDSGDLRWILDSWGLRCDRVYLEAHAAARRRMLGALGAIKYENGFPSMPEPLVLDVPQPL